MISWRLRERSSVPVDWFEKNRKYALQVDDVCLTAAGHRPKYIGLKVDLVDDLPEGGAIASAEVMVVRLHPDAPIQPTELLLFLRSEFGYSQIQDAVRGSTGHLYPKDALKIRVPKALASVALESVRELHSESVASYRRHRLLEERIATEFRAALDQMEGA